MPARREQHQPVVAQLHAVEARVGGHLRHHGDVGAMVDQLVEHRGRVVDLEREGQPLVLAPQRRQDRHHVVGAVGGNAQVPAGQRARAREQRLRFLLGGEQPRRDGVQRLPGRGELHAAPIAGEQTDAVARLQRLDLARQGRLAYSGGPGRVVSSPGGLRGGRREAGSRSYRLYLYLISKLYLIYRRRERRSP